MSELLSAGDLQLLRDQLSQYYQWLRAGHILSIIAWMAGMLYLPRLYVYHTGAALGGELDETLKIQERRLLGGIMNPAMVAAWTFGILMLIAHWELLRLQSWLHAKLALVVIMSGVHGYYSGARRKFERGERPHSRTYWRIMNEVPTLLVIAIVILAVVKPMFRF